MIEIPSPPKRTGDDQRDLRAVFRYLQELWQTVRMNLEELNQQEGEDT